MAALEQEGAGQGPAKRPQVPGLVDAGLVPLQSLMHHCWHQVSNSSSRLTVYAGGQCMVCSLRTLHVVPLMYSTPCIDTSIHRQA